MVNSNVNKSTSVIIPASTNASYLKDSISSLIGSKDHIREVLIVFSNFPEDQKCLFNSVLSVFGKDLNIILLDDTSKYSNGATARNLGIEHAVGDYIAFLDDDDYWTEDKLECYFDFLPSISSDTFLLFSPVVKCKRGMQGKTIGAHYHGQDISNYLFLDKGVAQTSSWFMPTHVAKQIKFNPKLVRHQDYDFCLRSQKAGISFFMYPTAKSYWVENENKNFVSKGARFDFCRSWVLEYKSLISERALVGYFAKDFFYIAYKEKRLLSFVAISLKQLGLLGTLRLLRLLMRYYAN